MPGHTPPTLAFLLRTPAHFVALGFGAGLAPVAPGTFGTIVAIPIAVLLRAYFPDAIFIGAMVLFMLAGIWAVQVTGRDLGVPDHGAIVWDEIVAFMLVLYFFGGDVVHIAVAFIVFRFFDIVKPPPIRQLDAALKNGIGVMLDDILAAIYTLIVLWLLQRFVG